MTANKPPPPISRPANSSHSPVPKRLEILPTDSLRIFHWLGLGLKDMCHSPALSLLHGLCVAVGGAGITWLAHDRFWLLVGAMSGFLVVAPVMATSLYAMSRAIEKKHTVDFQLLRNTWTQWQRNQETESYWCLVRFGLLLGLAGTGWVVTSSALITLLAPLPIHTPMDFIRHVVLNPDSCLFELWLLIGGLMAAPVFASSVVSMPLLLDRKVTTLQAVLTSWNVVMVHPMAMGFWSLTIMALSLLGFMTLFVGLVIVVPLLGHASWHAYKDLVNTDGVAERLPPQEVV